METSQPPLSIESFSYSWLVNLKPSLESLDFDNSLSASLDAAPDELARSFIEMDPRMPPSKRSFKNSKDFKFDFPKSDSDPLTVVHADEIFSNCYLLPLLVDSMEKDMHKASDKSAGSNLPPPPPSIFSKKKSPIHSGLLRSSSVRRCGRLSKRLLQKYLDFLMPLYRRVRGNKSKESKTENADKFDRRLQCLKTKSWMYSSDQTSPRTSVAYSADDWRRSCDSESSINEAVLHCKRSIEKMTYIDVLKRIKSKMLGDKYYEKKQKNFIYFLEIVKVAHCDLNYRKKNPLGPSSERSGQYVCQTLTMPSSSAPSLMKPNPSSVGLLEANARGRTEHDTSSHVSMKDWKTLTTCAGNANTNDSL